MSLAQALAASILAIRTPALLQAHVENERQRTALYRDTPSRRRLRALLDGAALADATVRLGVLKTGGDLRYMTCRPCQDTDGTCRYYTVQDLELSEQAARTVYRRVNLDTILAAEVSFRA